MDNKKPLIAAVALSATAFVVGVILLVGFALFAFLAPIQDCRGCHGIGNVPDRGFICRGRCAGDGKLTLWEKFRP